MSKASTAATKVIREYFASTGRTAPTDAASAILTKVRVSADLRCVEMAPAVECEASRVLEQACFDVDDLVENHLGIRLHIESLVELDKITGARVFGHARPGAHEITICERAVEYPPLYRATMMHEAAHVLLHNEPHARWAAYSPNSKRRPAHEREADEFMHLALLPPDVLLLGIACVANAYNLSFREAFESANSGLGSWQWQHRYFPVLVNRLCVSKHLIAIRHKSNGFLSEQGLRHHLSYAIPNRWLDARKSSCPPAFSRYHIGSAVKRLYGTEH